jgi:hypothetical protein
MQELPKNREQAEEVIVARAREDAAFRQQLLADPKGALSSNYGVRIPEGVQVSVLQESRKQRFLVLPAAAGDEELSEEELANVSGGGDCGCHCSG